MIVTGLVRNVGAAPADAVDVEAVVGARRVRAVIVAQVDALAVARGDAASTSSPSGGMSIAPGALATFVAVAPAPPDGTPVEIVATVGGGR